MKIIYKRGSVIESSEPLLIHGCNAQGVMNAGVAKLVRARFPDAYRAYIDAYEKRGKKLPVGLPIFSRAEDRVVCNLITQERYGRLVGFQYVDYTAIRQGFKRINAIIPDLLGGILRSAAMPPIGAGLGGGDWNIISQIIQEEATEFQPYVYLLPEDVRLIKGLGV